jgi:hypothetical protein
MAPASEVPCRLSECQSITVLAAELSLAHENAKLSRLVPADVPGARSCARIKYNS